MLVEAEALNCVSTMKLPSVEARNLRNFSDKLSTFMRGHVCPQWCCFIHLCLAMEKSRKIQSSISMSTVDGVFSLSFTHCLETAGHM